MQIVYEEAKLRVALHPSQLPNQFFIGKVMTKEGRKDDIGFSLHLQKAVIGMNKVDVFITCLALGKDHTGFGQIHSNELHRKLNVRRPPLNGPQVVAAATTNFQYRKRFVKNGPLLNDGHDSVKCNLVTAEMTINKIKFLHVAPYVGKRNIIAVKKFFLIGAVSEQGLPFEVCVIQKRILSQVRMRNALLIK